jgi:autotransporter-associated beta strand protein/T5SS/PEP-CTERM-associated repeat protein
LKKIIDRFLCLILGLFTTTSVFADTWTGNADGNWFNAPNWASNTVPGASTDISVDSTTSAPLINSPNVNSGSALARDILLGLSANGSGTLNIATGGQLSASTADLGVNDTSSGTIIISDTNSQMNLTGSMVVGNAGSATLDILNSGILNSGSGDVGAQATSSGTAVLVGGQWNNAGALVIGDQGTGTLVVVSGGVVLDTNGIVGNINNGGSGSGIGSGSITISNVGSQWLNSGELILANGVNTSANMDISDSGEVTAFNTILANQTGSIATVTLENAGTVWTNSSLVIGQDGLANVTLSDSAVLNVNGSAGITIGAGSVLNIGAADGSGAAAGGTLNSPAIFLNNNSNIFFNHTDLANVVNANISGGGAITQEGTGTTVLNGSNSYTGGTTISAGTLQGSSSGLQGNILNNSHLIFDQTSTGTFTGVISGSGDLTKNNNGTVILQNPNTYLGATFITAGTLQIPAETSLGAPGLPVTFIVDPNNPNAVGALAVSQSLTLQRGIILTNSGGLSATGQDTVFTPTSITGAGNLITAGSGTVLFNTLMTYTGTTTIAQGTLAAGANNILTNSPTLIIAPGGTFDLAGFPQAVNNLQNNGVITLAAHDNSPLAANTLVVDNNLSGNGSVKMTADLGKNINDLLTVNGTSSGHENLILNDPDQATDPAAGTVMKLVQTSDGVATFSGATEAGTFLYFVSRGNDTAVAPDPNAWYLVRLDLLNPNSGIPIKDLLTSTATAAIGMFSASVPLFYADMQTLTARLGDLRLGDASGAWIRAFGNKMEIDNQISRPFNQNTGGIQAGFDKA